MPEVRCPNAPDRLYHRGHTDRENTEPHRVESEPPHITPARGPLLRDDCDVQAVEGVAVKPEWDLTAQPAPDYEVDQRTGW